MTRLSKILLILAAISFIGSIILFAYKQDIFVSSEINAERFSQFGTFVSAILGFITVVFIYFTFKQAQQTQQIADTTLSEAQKKSLDSTFFSLIQSHQSLVNHLHQRISLPLKLEYVKLSEDAGNHNPNNDHKDFFELMYVILDLFYKKENPNKDKEKIVQYFKNQEWAMGHYFKSLTYFINWVESSSELGSDVKQREFYIGFIQSQLTIDELRLFFYYALSRQDSERQKLCKTLNRYSFFNSVKDTLIFQGQSGDWEYFTSTVQ